VAGIEEEDGVAYGDRKMRASATLRESVQPLQRAATMALNTTTMTLKRSSTEVLGVPRQGERRVRLNGGIQANKESFASNAIKTSKYNIITFLPVFLFEMFSRIAYLYFLFQAVLSWWEVVSPTGGAGSTMALMFVLVVAGVKAIAEDMKRHREDKLTNNTKASIMKPDGSTMEVRWRDLKVGNIVKVADDELIPADLLCLHSELPDNVCFVKTTNLDGESNLKIRRPLQLRELIQTVKDLGPGGLVHIRGVLQCEEPNADLHNFKGRFSWINEDGRPNVLPVTMNEILLRGTLLKNSVAVYGLVVYTGEETRIQKNNAKVPFKNGAYNKFLNLQISLVGLMQMLLCAFFAIMAFVWKQAEGTERYYMAFNIFVEGNYRDPAVYILINFLTFWILESYMVPISLFVTVEIVKFWQGFVFINSDPQMVSKETGEKARCRNSNLMEDLGKVDYVFSDKTGTLTCNDMRLRQIAVKGVVYGKKEVELERDGPADDWSAAMEIFDPSMKQCLLDFKRMTNWSKWTLSGGSRMGLKLGSQHRLNLAGEVSSSQSSSYEHTKPANGAGGSRLSPMDGSERSNLCASLDQPEPANPSDILDMAPAAERDPAEGNGAMEPTAPSPTPLDSYGRQEDADEEALVKSLTGLNGLHLIDFWTNICVCHSLIVETDSETGEKTVQGPSPDEVALVSLAKQLGFNCEGRDSTSIYLDLQGEKIQYEVLNVIEFTSDRRRMSVIARAPDGTIRLFLKGADSAVLALMNKKDMDKELLEETDRNLHRFAQQGLRTLCVATKVLTQEDWQAWDEKYQDAAASLDDRDAQIAHVAEEIERDLDLVGITAIEDKLQDGVPETISTLLDAGIRVWMITGDKRETAINIAVSCRLLKKPEDALLCEAESSMEAERVLGELLQRSLGPDRDTHISNSRVLVRNSRKSKSVKASARPDSSCELVIDGRTLKHILGTHLEGSLALLGSRCGAVVVCRASPSQKAAIVRMMKRFEADQAAGDSIGLIRWYRHYQRDINSKMLSIGDGANDVAMIQAADIGVGVMGKEGRQAVNNSDYAIAQFSFLARLLLVHGQLSDYRLAYLVKYSFYKNICFATVLSCYQFFNGFSGTTVIDDISAFMYNVVFTSMPIGCFALFDRMVSDTSLLLNPRTYNNGNFLTATNFWKTGILQGILDGAIIFFVPFLGADPYNHIQLLDVGSLGKMVFLALMGSVTLEVALASRYWTHVFTFFTLVSYFFVYVFIPGYSAFLISVDSPDPLQTGVGAHLASNPNTYLAIALVNIATTGHRLLLFSVMWAFFPSDFTLLKEREDKYGPFYEVGWQALNRLVKIGCKVPEDLVPPPKLKGPSTPVSPVAAGRKPQPRQVEMMRQSAGRSLGALSPLQQSQMPEGSRAQSQVSTPQSLQDTAAGSHDARV